MNLTSGETRKKRIRLIDIARIAGVSRATVSLAMRNHPSIPEHTRDRVQQTATRLGYVYNRGAANLRSASTKTIGVVVHDITNPYFAEIIASIQDEVNLRGHVVLFGNTLDSHDRQVDFLKILREYNVDGIALCPAVDTDPQWLQDVQNWGIPMALFSRRLPGVEIDYVGIGNREGMHEATSYLLDLGHQRIAMIGANSRISTGLERLDGYRDALVERGIFFDEALVCEGSATREFGMDAVLSLFERTDPPTAAVCFNDIVAFGVMLGLRHSDREPGREFAVVGFDDIAEASLWKPTLSSVSFDVGKIGQETFDLISRRAAEPSRLPEARILTPKLVIRGSS